MLEAKQKARRIPGGVAWLLSLLMASLTVACANDRGPHPDLPRIGVSTVFTARNLCSEGVSPAVTLISPPAGAATYRVKMTMASALAAPSWQFDVPVSAKTLLDATPPNAVRTAGTIAEGAITDFPAPCPPERQIYIYRIEVMALGAGGAPLGYGWGFVTAQSLTRQLAAERVLQQRFQKARDDAAARGLPPPVQELYPSVTSSLLPYAVGSGYPPETTAYFFVY